MKKNTILSAFLGLYSLNAQTTIFEDSFENYSDFAYITGTVGSWTLTDLDGQGSYSLDESEFPNEGIPKAFIVFNRGGIVPATTSMQTTARTGNKAMACFNVSEGDPLANNDWLISPRITLGSSGNSLSFWAKSINELYGLEKFNIWISTTNTAIASFTKLNPVTIVTPPVTQWNQHNFNLDAYSGQNVYIAIQCVSDDQFALFIDDFKVTATGALDTSEVSKKAIGISVYPNPAVDVLTLKSKEKVVSTEVFDMSGRKVNASLNNNQVDVRNLKSGNYIINIETKEGRTTEKFIKK
ncbi:T9SS-dependent choice-of-anchor J family protein [Chryseobacterium sp. OV279]|uniref:T9SS-dependent choice-of-anchor J family protein n=1 Tax=Chryseobacterium sp. OV279 TaxID=1500285 RepID=UPI000915AD64|nr:choice-of-anchor J domain-containing protein [Chryseobacterium sp. OV279]SHF38763.1 Por secretion system C-terminal sorting domain-containing protein [Chryseobacterium sp. OV279]